MELRRRSTGLPAVSQPIRKQPEADAEELLVRMLELGLDGVRRLVADRQGVQGLLQKPAQRRREWSSVFTVPHDQALPCGLGMHT